MEAITEDIVTCSPSFDPLPAEEEATLKIEERLSAGIDIDLKSVTSIDNKLKIE